MKTKILPEEAEQALKKMIAVTRDMKNIVKGESDALAANDGDALRTAIDQKADLAFMYGDASREFSKRLEEFRAMPPALLDELDREQKALKAVEEENRVFYNRARGKTA